MPRAKLAHDAAGMVYKKWYRASETGCEGGTGTCSITPTTALTPAGYKWWIQSYNTAGYGPWSDAKAFTVSAGKPGKATLLSPSGSITDNTPAYQWNAMAEVTWYYLWVNDAGGNKVKRWYRAGEAGCADGTGTCSVTPAAGVSGAAQWWIQAYSMG